MAHPFRLPYLTWQSYKRMDRLLAGWLSFCVAWKHFNAVDGTLSVFFTRLALTLQLQLSLC